MFERVPMGTSFRSMVSMCFSVRSILSTNGFDNPFAQRVILRRSLFMIGGAGEALDVLHRAARAVATPVARGQVRQRAGLERNNRSCGRPRNARALMESLLSG